MSGCESFDCRFLDQPTPSPNQGHLERAAAIALEYAPLFDLSGRGRRELDFRQLDLPARAFCNFRVEIVQFGAVVRRLLAQLRSLSSTEAPLVSF